MLGTMSDHDFCSWVLASPSRIRNATVRDVTWWRSHSRPFHHQFIVITVEYRNGFGAPVSTYDIKAERHGKGRNFGWLAEHRITISHTVPFESYLAKNSLLLGLIGGGQAWGAGRRELPPSFETCDAFRDAVDEQWRGPPATLGHIARYIQSIVQLAPRYSLSSTNCYFFSRLLIHCIALRHYSFSRIATSSSFDLAPMSMTHDPSAISSVFHFLARQERASNGILFYRVLYYVIVGGLLLGCIVAYVVLLVIFAKKDDGKTSAIAWSIIWLLVIFFVPYIAALWLDPLLLQSRGSRIATRTDKLIQMLGECAGLILYSHCFFPDT
ncbi:hypothetical protein DL93DRAFT_177265 [Clavulina sp. PMI_390]|nr:hypothetical protein DL93DRAFT_177265 [Clavulina sp. PMI_390]